MDFEVCFIVKCSFDFECNGKFSSFVMFCIKCLDILNVFMYA